MDDATPGPQKSIETPTGVVKLTWFEDGAHAVVHIIRKKDGAFFRMSRDEATALRALLPANQPD